MPPLEYDRCDHQRAQSERRNRPGSTDQLSANPGSLGLVLQLRQGQLQLIPD